MSVSSRRAVVGEDPPVPRLRPVATLRPAGGGSRAPAAREALGAPRLRIRAWTPCPDRHAAEPSHLRVDRPSDGVVLVTLDNPGQRNAMSAAMTQAWAAAMAELAARPDRAGARGDRRGQRLLLRRRPALDRRRPRRGRPRAAHPDDRLLPGLALGPRARGAHHRGRQRSGGRRRPVPGAGLRPALRRRRRRGCRCPSSSWGCTPAWPRPTRCPTSSARPTRATCCSPGASSTPRRPTGSAWCPGSSPDESFLDEVLGDGARDRRDGPGREPADQGRAARRRPRRLRRRAGVGGAGPAGHAGHRGPAGGRPGRGGATGAGVHRPLSRVRPVRRVGGPGTRRGPRPARIVTCLPLASDGPSLAGGLFCVEPRDVRRHGVNDPSSTSVDNPVDNVWRTRGGLWNAPRNPCRMVGRTRPGGPPNRPCDLHRHRSGGMWRGKR